jgi:hypothetical protein
MVRILVQLWSAVAVEMHNLLLPTGVYPVPPAVRKGVGVAALLAAPLFLLGAVLDIAQCVRVDDDKGGGGEAYGN